MIQKFLKYSRLKQYDYLFGNSRDHLVHLNANYNIRISNHGTSYDMNMFISKYIDICYYPSGYVVLLQYHTKEYICWGSVLLYKDQPICYCDKNTSTFIIVNTVSSEVKDLLYEHIYKTKSDYNTYFQKVLEVDCLEYEDVYLYPTGNSFNLIKKVFYEGLTTNEILRDNDKYFICDIPINNEHFFCQLNVTISRIPTRVTESNDYYNNFYGTVYNDNTETNEDDENEEEELEEELIEDDEDEVNF